MRFIATVYSHYGAIRYKKACEQIGLSARLGPVPRALSSSCGTCVIIDASSPDQLPPFPEEIEQVAEETPTGYARYYTSQN